MVNVPRALFATRTRPWMPRYHIAIDQLQDWTYLGEPLVPLKGFPGVVWERPNRKKRGPVRRTSGLSRHAQHQTQNEVVFGTRRSDGRCGPRGR